MGQSGFSTTVNPYTMRTWSDGKRIRRTDYRPMGFLLFYFNWGLYGYDWLSIRGHIKEYCQLPTYLIRRFHFHNLCRIDDPKSSSSKLGVCPATPSQFAVQSFTAMRNLGIKWNVHDYACLASDSDVLSDFTSSIITSQSPTLLALR